MEKQWILEQWILEQKKILIEVEKNGETGESWSKKNIDISGE